MLSCQRLFWVVAVFGLLPACQWLPPVAREWIWPPLHRETATPATTVQNAEIDKLLAKGELALSKDRLTSPTTDNAALYYRKVLALSPNNPAARDGLEQIAKRYMDLARMAHDNGDEGKARKWLLRAQEVNGNSEALQSLRTRLQNTQSGQNPRGLNMPEINLKSLQDQYNKNK